MSQLATGLLRLPENLEPSEVKSAQLEWHSSSMHENGFHQGRSKCTEVQHAPHTGNHPQLVFCFLYSAMASADKQCLLCMYTTQIYIALNCN